MNDLLSELVLYLRLAQAFKNRLQMSDRDRALVMAGTCAATYNMHSVAAFCRKLILQNNHGHMVRKWPTFSDALEDADFLHFLRQIHRRISIERAETQLIEYGYRCDVKLNDYDDEQAYVAAVMGIDVDWLAENFG